MNDIEFYTLEGFTVQSGSDSSRDLFNQGFQKRGDFYGRAIGSGPVDAAFKAIERITASSSGLSSIRFSRSPREKDAIGEAMVKLKKQDGEDVVTGHGLSTDIIEASIKAYVNGVNKILASASN
jgi:2-isopropylmalate synthase